MKSTGQLLIRTPFLFSASSALASNGSISYVRILSQPSKWAKVGYTSPRRISYVASLLPSETRGRERRDDGDYEPHPDDIHFMKIFRKSLGA